jgi:ABC-type nitrate/sulfonate/bicarbonate transport system substrate-binding protein
MTGVIALILLLFLTFAPATRAENVKVGIPSLTVTMLPLAVAGERGHFQQEGLNVELVLMPRR